MKLQFDPNPSRQWPHGYWHAVTNDGGWDAIGATPLDATAALVAELERARREGK